MPPKEYLCDCTRFFCVGGRTQPKIIKKATWHKHAPYRKAAEQPQITPIRDFLAHHGVPFEAPQPAQPHPHPSCSPPPGPSNKRPRLSRNDAEVPISENIVGHHIISSSSTNEEQVVESNGGAEEQHSDNGSYLGLFSEDLDGDDVGVVRVHKSMYLFNSANKIIIALNICSPDQAHPFFLWTYIHTDTVRVILISPSDYCSKHVSNMMCMGPCKVTLCFLSSLPPQYLLTLHNLNQQTSG